MARFKKLTLDELKQSFELVSEDAQRALYGGTGVSGTPEPLFDESPVSLYSSGQIDRMVNGDYPVSPASVSGGGSGSGDNYYYDGVWGGELDEVTIIAYGGIFCNTHDLYFPKWYGECPKCSEDEIDQQFYDAKYGQYSYSGGQPDSGSGNSGGVVGGGSTGGNGSGNTVYIPFVDLPSKILGKFVKAEDPQDRWSTCLIENITQAKITLSGENLKFEACLLECSKLILEYRRKQDPEAYADCHEYTMAKLITEKGIYGQGEIDLLLDHFFTGVEIASDDFMRAQRIDTATNQGQMVFAKKFDRKDENGDFSFHSVVIVDISQAECTYYDPMIPDVYKKCNIGELSSFRIVSSLK